MAKNYYEILDLQRNCSEADIMKAYRKLALRYHPNKTKEDKIVANYLFNQISEAYEVLSDFKKRSCYDQLGEFGLKSGGPDGKNGYRYLNNPEDIFQEFFKSTEVLQSFFGAESIPGSLFGSSMLAMNRPEAPKPENLEVKVQCSLEDLYNGCRKTLEFNKVILNPDKISTSIQRISKSLDIKKGSKDKKTIIFPSEGNMSALYPPSDLIFIIEELKHERFKRQDCDLKYTHRLSLIESINALPIEIRMLDNRVITVSFEEIIAPNTIKTVANEGMPIEMNYETISNSLDELEQQEQKVKGDLIIEFNIKFPKHLPADKKRQAIELLT